MASAGEVKNGRRAAGPRLIAVVGPFQSGKTTLLESLLARSGVLQRQGNVRDATTIGDASPEARAHAMSVEANVATTEFLGDLYTFIDCPGSVEFLQDMRHALPACDAAVVVCEADERKVPALQLILHELEEQNVPRFLFLNKIDAATAGVRETIALLQPASRTPLLLRQIPVWQGGTATGFIDLALERAFVYREHAPSSVIDLPKDHAAREKDARYSMLERLADYDDELMEQLIGDIEPPRDKIFEDLAHDLRAGHVVPMLLGSAERGHGVTRLLKALRHEAPGLADTRQRLAVAAEGAPLAYALRSIHTAHGGKLSLARVLRGSFSDGQTVRGPAGEDRIAGISRMMGATAARQPSAAEGEMVAFGRLDHIPTGAGFVAAKAAPDALPQVAVPPPVHAFALTVADRKDDVRLAAALAKLVEEDPSLTFVHDQASGELRLMGQGEMHLRVAIERLSARFGVQIHVKERSVAYRETIRETVNVRGRHKKQSGGHGQFGDVALTVRPLPRGEGFVFEEEIHGGVVPRQYFPSVEIGVRDGLTRGPLGFPVVDVAVTLTDGSYHSVDSSDMAFRAAAKIALAEGLAKAKPVLLEPILAVDIVVPSEAMARATALVASRRGQLLGYDARPGWEGWDVLKTQIPEAEMGSLIVELRSATAGVGSYVATFDHLAEIVGRQAEAIVAHQHAVRAG
jgi:elongation factor G